MKMAAFLRRNLLKENLILFFETFKEYMGLLCEREIGNAHNMVPVSFRGCRSLAKTMGDLRGRISCMTLGNFLRELGGYGLNGEYSEYRFLRVIGNIVEVRVQNKVRKLLQTYNNGVGNLPEEIVFEEL